MSSVLLLEDDPLLAQSLMDLLHSATYSVEWASTLHEAWFYLKKRSFDLLILDRNLEDGEGLEVVKYVHQHSYPSKMLILSQKSQVLQRIEGLQAGADEYLPKPFSLTELMLRLEKLNTITKTFKKDEIKIGTYTFYPQQGHLYQAGKYSFLRKREAKVLLCLCVHANLVLSRSQLTRWVWSSYDIQPALKSIDTYIKRIRHLLGKEKDRLETVRGFGYRLRLD